MKNFSHFLNIFLASCFALSEAGVVRADGSADATVRSSPASSSPAASSSVSDSEENPASTVKTPLSTEDAFKALASKIRGKATRDKSADVVQLTHLAQQLASDFPENVSLALFPILAEQTARYEEFQHLVQAVHLTPAHLQDRIVPILELVQDQMKAVRDRFEQERLLRLALTLIRGPFNPDAQDVPNPRNKAWTRAALLVVKKAFPYGKSGDLGFFVQEFLRHYGQVLYVQKSAEIAYHTAVQGIDRFKSLFLDVRGDQSSKLMKFANTYKADLYRAIVALPDSISNERLQHMGSILVANPRILDILTPEIEAKDRFAFLKTLYTLLATFGTDPQPEQWLRLTPSLPPVEFPDSVTLLESNPKKNCSA